MTEIHFIVEEAPEGGFVARAMGAGLVKRLGRLGYEVTREVLLLRLPE